MVSAHLLVAFILASLALNVTPGPDMALTLTRGMTQGFGVAFMSVLGTFAAGAVQVPLIVLGLAEVFRQSPELFATVKVIGALYLTYLGSRALLRSTRREQGFLLAELPRGRHSAFVQELLTNLLNPKVFLFLTAFLPQFTDPAIGPVWRQTLVLAVISKMVGFAVYVGLAAGASSIRKWLVRNAWFMRIQEEILGAVMLTIAGFLLFHRSGSLGGRAFGPQPGRLTPRRDFSVGTAPMPRCALIHASGQGVVSDNGSAGLLTAAPGSPHAPLLS